jgi:hypothetical protein
VFRPFFIRGATPSEQRAYDLPESARNLVLGFCGVNPLRPVFLACAKGK